MKLWVDETYISLLQLLHLLTIYYLIMRSLSQ